MWSWLRRGLADVVDEIAGWIERRCNGAFYLFDGTRSLRDESPRHSTQDIACFEKVVHGCAQMNPGNSAAQEECTAIQLITECAEFEGGEEARKSYFGTGWRL